MTTRATLESETYRTAAHRTNYRLMMTRVALDDGIHRTSLKSDDDNNRIYCRQRSTLDWTLPTAVRVFGEESSDSHLFIY